MKGDNTLMILWCYQFNYLWYSNNLFLCSVSKEMTVAERDVVIPLMMQVHKDANTSCLKEANLRESFLWLFQSKQFCVKLSWILKIWTWSLLKRAQSTRDRKKTRKKGEGRLGICRDRRDRRSCKIFVRCVNFSRKQRSSYIFCKFTHT